MEKMADLMAQEKFSIVSNADKTLLIALDEEMAKLGYGIYESIDAWEWSKNWFKARYQINYTITKMKKRKYMAHVFIKDDGSVILLRLLTEKIGANSHNTRQESCSFIDPHREYIENAPAHVKELFTKKSDCNHTHENENGFCWRLDTYTINNVVYEKCVGKGFDFWNPTMEKLPDYMDLLSELKPKKTIQ